MTTLTTLAVAVSPFLLPFHPHILWLDNHELRQRHRADATLITSFCCCQGSTSLATLFLIQDDLPALIEPPRSSLTTCYHQHRLGDRFNRVASIAVGRCRSVDGNRPTTRIPGQPTGRTGLAPAWHRPGTGLSPRATRGIDRRLTPVPAGCQFPLYLSFKRSIPIIIIIIIIIIIMLLLFND